MLSWIIPYKRFRWTAAGGRAILLARLDEAFSVQQRDSTVVLSFRGLHRNPYRPHLHLRIAGGEAIEITGWMAPALHGVAGVFALGALAWWFEILPGIYHAPAAALATHLAFWGLGYVRESRRLEAKVADIVRGTTIAGHGSDNEAAASNNRLKRTAPASWSAAA